MLGATRAERFFETTRGRIVALLRRAGRTVEELAQALGLTDNAVRAHLATLERDGMVRADGVRYSGRVGKPATVYQVSPEAELAFSRAFPPFFTALLGTLAERLPEDELLALLRDTGRRLAASGGAPAGDLAQRTRVASELLNQLGGLTEVREVDPGQAYLIEGCGCPLGVAVAQRPEVCQAVVALVAELTGAEVRERCAHGDRPSCRFAVGAADGEPTARSE